MYLLDTDTLSHLWQGNQSVKERLRDAEDTEIGITAITKSEILRARCDNLLKADDAAEILRAQQRFTRTEELLVQLTVIPFENTFADSLCGQFTDPDDERRHYQGDDHARDKPGYRGCWYGGLGYGYSYVSPDKEAQGFYHDAPALLPLFSAALRHPCRCAAGHVGVGEPPDETNRARGLSDRHPAADSPDLGVRHASLPGSPRADRGTGRCNGRAA